MQKIDLVTCFKRRIHKQKKTRRVQVCKRYTNRTGIVGRLHLATQQICHPTQRAWCISDSVLLYPSKPIRSPWPSPILHPQQFWYQAGSQGTIWFSLFLINYQVLFHWHQSMQHHFLIKNKTSVTCLISHLNQCYHQPYEIIVNYSI